MSATKARIVIVEDDPTTAKIIQFILEDEGYEAVAAHRGAQGYALVVTRETNLVILDVSLPDISGFALARELRANHYTGPIMFVTGHGDVSEKLMGFQTGADDYMVKPFEPPELLARVESILRRYHSTDQQSTGTVIQVEDAELSIGDLTYTSAVTGPVQLTPTEMRMLECLMRNSWTVISRETLIERVWGYEFLGDTNRVDVYIRRVRRKIETDPTNPRYLHTARGIGYVFRVETEGESGFAGDSVEA